MGPLLWNRPAPEDAGSRSAVPDYRIREERGEAPPPKEESSDTDSEKEKAGEPATHAPEVKTDSKLAKEVEDPHPIVGPWAEPKNLWIIARYKAIPFLKKAVTHGTSVDIHALQGGDSDRLKAVHERAKQSVIVFVLRHPSLTGSRYPNDTEHLYSFMQVISACTASFAHGGTRKTFPLPYIHLKLIGIS